MSYCDLCNGLTIEELFPPSIYRHAKSLAALKQSSQNCSLCMLLYRCITASGSEYSEYNPQPLGDHSNLPRLVGYLVGQPACDVGVFNDSTKDEDATVAREDIQSCDDDSIRDEDSTSDVGAYGGDSEGTTSDDVCVKLQIIEETERHSSSINLDGFTHIGVWIKPKRMLTSLTLAVQEAFTRDGRDRFISGRVLTSEYPPDAYFQVIQRWFKTCEHAHSNCGSDSTPDSKLPDRVIDVALLGGHPRLVDGSGLTSRYATLSHCWGRVIPGMRTLVCNLEQRKIRMHLEEFPKTFREAITICRQLMIPYLWIDSICIVQDSLEDWETQSSKMHSIYHDSTITLAALDATNSSEGLFLPKRPFIDVFPLAYPFGGDIGQAYVGVPTWNKFTHCPLPTYDKLQFHTQILQNLFGNIAYIKSGLLDTRAWAMQEMRLSRRLLYFFHGEVMWRCTEGIWRQNGCRQSPKKTHHLHTALAKYEKELKLVRKTAEFDRMMSGCQEQSATSSVGGDNESEGRAGDTKGESPESCSHVNSTAAEDQNEVPAALIGARRLPKGGNDLTDSEDDSELEDALTGISHLTESDFSGLLESEVISIQKTWYDLVDDYSSCQLTFAEDKLPALSGMASRFHAITRDQYIAGHWKTDIEKSLFWGSYQGGFRVKPYRAPTWSWASMDGIIKWVEDEEFLTGENSAQDHFRILDACVQVVGKNPFGRVMSGKLVIRASSMEAHWNSDRRGWISSSSPCPYKGYADQRLAILDYNGGRIGCWNYDEKFQRNRT
ncbi:heterokaryon incompatibility protein-domain-containing protein [Boeremia exigua]|uniref:heterokaryon incompatibility protein-domain-containing protein n=1 Tax=Boeremia exigua TaxID=749465 RepID=UPI001E8E9034|nr:heterokaryon incompatibility protein-domain-containing protein [Boeremia exigua]KAH6615180.1 heterokaryon incompatibility protein-domain-containing protein [Boeremia exigua]